MTTKEKLEVIIRDMEETARVYEESSKIIKDHGRCVNGLIYAIVDDTRFYHGQIASYLSDYAKRLREL